MYGSAATPPLPTWKHTPLTLIPISFANLRRSGTISIEAPNFSLKSHFAPVLVVLILTTTYASG